MGLWIQWWLLPHFDKLIQQGELKKGRKMIGTSEYEGYLNKEGKCYGVGTLINKDGDKWEGTWIDNKEYVFSKCNAQHPQNIGSHHHCSCTHMA